MESERILVVDDDPDFLGLMALHLRKRGYQVSTAADGEAGRQILAGGESFAVLVTDMTMPVMSGLELLRAARQLDPLLEVIIITAAGTLETAITAMREDGAYDFLLKPLDNINVLSLAVGRAVAHRRLRLTVASEMERLQALVANTSDAILMADADGVLRLANPVAARLLERADLVGLPALSGLPAPIATVINNWQSVGGPPSAIEVQWPAEATQLVNLSPLPGRSGAASGWVMVLRDITHLKRLDEKRMHLLTETVSKLRLPLAQALITVVELNNLLQAQGGSAAELITRLTKLWRRMQDWMDELMELVRIESGQNLRLASVELAPLLKKKMPGLSEPLHKRGLQLQLEVPADLPPVRADPNLLPQMLKGLLGRAAARSPQGGQIHLKAYAQPGQVWIDVSDDGPPVAESELPHIFEKAFDGANSAAGSTGLELALAKTIIERLGGQVWVRGEGPLGGTIALCLPVFSETG